MSVLRADSSLFPSLFGGHYVGGFTERKLMVEDLDGVY